MSERLRLFLVDDHELVRAGTRAMIDDAHVIVGEADDAEAAIELIRERVPDVVLVDVRLPRGGGATVVQEVKRTHPEIVFLALTVSTSREDVIRMLNAGVDGYVTKAVSGPQLLADIAKAHGGGFPASPQIAGYLLDIDEAIDVAASGLDKLTTREREVVSLIARGYSYQEAADQLGISHKTVETHMSHIFAKLGIASRWELTSRAYETGFLRPEDRFEDPDAGDG